MRKFKITVPLVLALLFLSCLFGCGKSEEVKDPETVYIHDTVKVIQKDTVYVPIDPVQPDDPDDPDEVDVATLFKDYPKTASVPSWTVSNTMSQYSMIFVCIPMAKNHQFKVGTDDLLGAFVNGVCCGVSKCKVTTTGNMFYLMIHLDAVPTTPITLKYYNASLKITLTDQTHGFVADKVFGTPDNPYILSMQ